MVIFTDNKFKQSDKLGDRRVQVMNYLISNPNINVK